MSTCALGECTIGLVGKCARNPPTRPQHLSRLPRWPGESAARCLIHLTCRLYSVLNVVNSILWQTHYYQLQHAGAEIFLYPRASENFGDVSQKLANRRPSSIRTMKSRPPIRRAAMCAPANGVWAPPRVILRSEDTAYRLCSLTHSHCRPLRSSYSPLVSITHGNLKYSKWR